MSKMSSCIILYEQEDIPNHPPNCPSCGRWLKWEGWEKGYSCKCDGVINIRGSGETEGEYDDDEYAMRVCKKPEGWKTEWGTWLSDRVDILDNNVKEDVK